MNSRLLSDPGLAEDLSESERLKILFQDIFTDAVLEGLESIVGKSGCRAMVYHLRIRECAGDPNELHQRIVSMFGSKGGLMIEIRITNVLCSKLNASFQIDRCTQDFFLQRNWRLASRAFYASI